MRTRGIQSTTAILLAAAMTSILAGCAPTAPEAAAPVPTPTVTVTVTPTPTPTPIPDPITCETAFIPEMRAKIEADGLTFRGAGSSGDIDVIVGADGLRCQWTRPNSDATARYASWDRDPAAWEALKAELLADSFFTTGPNSVSRLESDNDASYSYSDGVVHYARPWTFIGWATALQ